MHKDQLVMFHYTHQGYQHSVVTETAPINGADKRTSGLLNGEAGLWY